MPLDVEVRRKINRPDGYWELTDVETRTQLILARFHRDRLLQRKIELPSEEIVQRVCIAFEKISWDLTRIFILQHNEENYGKSWIQVDPHGCLRLEKTLVALDHQFEDFPVYQEVFRLLQRAIRSEGLVQNEEISNALTSCAIEMKKQHLPILLISLDAYLPGGDDMVQLEPIIEVMVIDHQYDELIELVMRELATLTGVEELPQLESFVGVKKRWAAWMNASLSYGNSLGEHAYSLSPENFKYTREVLYAMQYFGIELKDSDVQVLCVRALSAHEAGHSLKGDEEWNSDQVAIPAAFRSASKISEDELRKQIVFTFVEMCMQLASPGTDNKWEVGYQTSTSLTLKAMFESRLIEPVDGKGKVQPEFFEAFIQKMLAQSI